jgi:thymidylate synthase
MRGEKRKMRFQFWDPKTADEAWIKLLYDVRIHGDVSKPRGIEICELLGHKTEVDMRHPVVTNRTRKLSRKFLAGEAYWILTGDNRVSTIAPYNSFISKFSDDGTYFNGAYGPRVVDQMSYVVDSLVKDHDSRQAAMTIWRPNPRPSKDIPCTVAVQFLLREVDGVDRIFCVDTMRSSDCWLGWPYDVFNFTMLSACVALMYSQKTQRRVEPGVLILNAGSQHLYATNFEAAALVCDQAPPLVPMEPFSIEDFGSPGDLIEHLRKIRDGERRGLTSQFLTELLPKQGE